jgi:hypothetical protein
MLSWMKVALVIVIKQLLRVKVGMICIKQFMPLFNVLVPT